VSRFSSLSERIVSSLEFGELNMFRATILGELVNLCVEFITVALRLSLCELQLLCEGINAKLRDSG